MGPNEALLSHEHPKKTPASVFQPGPGPCVGGKGGIETPERIQIRHGRAYRLSKIEHSLDDLQDLGTFDPDSGFSLGP